MEVLANTLLVCLGFSAYLFFSAINLFPGTGALLRNSDFSDRGAGGKAAVPVRDDGVCLSAS